MAGSDSGSCSRRSSPAAASRPNLRAVTAAPAPAPPPEPRSSVYVTNEASGDLTVIDGERQTAIGTYPLGKRPRGIKVSPDGKSLFVALSGSPNAGPGVDPKTLPPPDRSADGIGEVDTATYKVKRVIQAGNDPEQLDISADGQRLYVANEDAAQVSVVDVPSGNVIATVKMGEEPEGVTIRPDGKVVYVTSEDEGAVYAIDTATNKVLKKYRSVTARARSDSCRTARARSCRSKTRFRATRTRAIHRAEIRSSGAGDPPALS